MEPGTLVAEAGEVISPDPAERRLRELYTLPYGLRVSMIRARDGSSVGPDGSSRSLNGPEDLRILRVTRSLADVVIVGAKTARVERYGDIRLGAALLAERGRPAPDLVIVTASGDVPHGLDPQRTWIVTAETAPAAAVAGPLAERVVILGRDRVDATALVEWLQRRGYRSLLCEGGPELASALLASRQVTDYCLTTSPSPSGAGPHVPALPEGARLAHTLRGGGFTVERWGLTT